MNKKKTAINRHQKNNFKIGEAIPQKVKEVFTRESRRKLDTLTRILEEDAVQERKHEIFVMAHGYKGNAGFLGLHPLAEAAKQTCAAINNHVPAKELIQSVKHLEQMVRKSLEANEYGV